MTRTALAAILAGALVLLLPVQYDPGGLLRIAPSDFLVPPLILALGLQVHRRTIPPPLVLLLAWFAVAVALGAVAIGEFTAYAWLSKGVGLLLLVALAAGVGTVSVRREELIRLVRLLVLGAAFLNAIALVEFALTRAGVLDIAFINYGTTRLSGLLVDPNAYGGLLVAVLFIGLGAQRAGWLGLPALLAPATFLSLAAGIALTSSRSAWMAAVFGLLLLALLAPRRALGGVTVIVVSLLAIALLTGPAFLEEAVTLAARRPQIESRLDFLEIAGREFTHSPVFGLGIGYFESTHGMIVHNTPAWLLFEAGVVGLVLYLVLVAHALWQGATAWRAAPPADRAGLVGLLTGFAAMLGLSLGIEALYQRHWWVLFAWLQIAPVAFRRDG